MTERIAQLTVNHGSRTPLAVLRFASDLTQKELAEACQLSTRTILRAEAGHRPSLKSAGVIARALSVSPAELWPELGSGNETDPTHEKTPLTGEVSR
jgi:transcriptional regulator with XRE-family HTH domain